MRCLGNGRPFILEITNSIIIPNNDILIMIINTISSKQDLNTNGDIEVLSLSLSNKKVWENMQKIAEEKKKAYRCIVYSSNILSSSLLLSIENNYYNDNDDDNINCLSIIQKTPLRVLHRRSLLDRKRYIYNIKTTLLSEHYMLLSLTTSAGILSLLLFLLLLLLSLLLSLLLLLLSLLLWLW